MGFVTITASFASEITAECILTVTATGDTEIAQGEYQNLSWVIDKDGLLTISGSGAMPDFAAATVDGVDKSNAPWVEYNTDIHALTIVDGITAVGKYAFRGLEQLTSVSLPASVTALGNSTFRDCTGLTELPITDSITSISGYAYGGCTGITSVVIPDSVTVVGGYAFRDCSGLTSIVIPDSVTTLGKYTFSGCTALSEISIPGTVTSIGKYAFYGCTVLAEITVPESVSEIGNCAFSACAGLKRITFLCENVTFGTGVIASCTALEKLICYEDSAVDTWVLEHGRTPEYIYVPVISVEFTAASVSMDCDESAALTVNVVTARGTYTNRYVTFTSSAPEIVSVDEDGFIYSHAEGTATITAEAESGVSASCVVVVERERMPIIAQGEYMNITWQIDQESVLTISGSGAMPGFAAATVDGLAMTSAPWAKYHANICSVVITDGITSVGAYAFRGIRELAAVSLPASVTAIGNSSFRNCTGLTALPDMDSVTTIGGYAFGGCTGISSIVLPDSVTTVGGAAFRDCSGLTSVVIPDSVTALGKNAFNSCALLKSVVLPDSITAIGEYTFNGCPALSEISIPGSVTSIGKYAFNGCTSLTQITVPASVNEIGNMAFASCTQLKHVTFRCETATMGTGILSGSTALEKIYCYEDSDIEAWALRQCYTVQYIHLPVISVRFAVESAEMYYNESMGLTAIVVNSRGSYINRYVTFTSSAPEIVIVDEDGTVYSQTEGTAIITATAENGVSASCVVTVKVRVTSVSFESRYVEAAYGDKLTAVVVADDIRYTNKLVEFSSSNENVLTVDSTGRITVNGAGYAIVTASHEELSDSCLVKVGNVSEFSMPAAMSEIGDEAFRNSRFKAVTIPETITTVGAYAFADNPQLTAVLVYGDATRFGADVFTGSDNVIIVCHEGSSAEAYARENGISYFIMDSMP